MMARLGGRHTGDLGGVDIVVFAGVPVGQIDIDTAELAVREGSAPTSGLA